jgi:hypothetical protein
MGASFGGIQTMLALEGEYGFRVAVNCLANRGAAGAIETATLMPDWGRSKKEPPMVSVGHAMLAKKSNLPEG